MAIKLTLICLVIAPLIIGKVSGIPTSKCSTRVGKLLGWFTGVEAVPLKTFTRKWTLKLGHGALMASVELKRYIDFHDWQKDPSVASSVDVLLQSDPTSITSNDLDPSNATSSSGAPSNVTTVIPLDEEAETTQRVPSAFELKDYDETTLEPDVEANRVRREASTRSNHGLRRSEDDSDDEAESTTTIAIPLEELASSEANLASLSPPPTAVASSHHNFYHIPSIGFPYPPSKFPSAEFVSITQSPLNRQRASVKNYYDFYPSQVDYNYHHFNPYCISYGHKSFNSFDQSTWLNNRKWRK